MSLLKQNAVSIIIRVFVLGIPSDNMFDQKLAPRHDEVGIIK